MRSARFVFLRPGPTTGEKRYLCAEESPTIMKNLLRTSALWAVVLAAAACTPRLRPGNIDRVIAAMTLEEKIHLLVGTSMDGKDDDGSKLVVGKTKLLVPGAAGTTYPIERLGIPAIVLADGPAGLRISPTRDGDTATYYCTGFPIASALASTWDPTLVEEVGRAMGDEVREYGVDILLAPGMNIMRNPLCGRNFEYYSEDPLLSGRTAAAMVRGVESNGVGCSIKHFAANNQEINRLCNDSRVSIRALREIYLRNFEIAVREAQPRTLMTSYNYVNGRYTSEDRGLLTDILRGDWGFRGTVMTDWSAGLDTPAQIAAGNDMIQPGSNERYEAILAAAREGRLPIEAIDTSVRRILELVVRSPRYEGYPFSNRPDLKAHADVARRAAAEGMILLENRGEALPLASGGEIALFGVTSYRLIAGGTGAGDVNKAYTVDLCDGLRNAGFTLNAAAQEAYAAHLAAEDARLAEINERRGWWFGPLQPDEMPNPAAVVRRSAATAAAAVVTIGRRGGEGTDRHETDDFLLKPAERRLIADVSRIYRAAGKPVVVVLNTGGIVETASWRDDADAVLMAWQAGQEGGNAVADVLAGKVNPAGRLPMTVPVRYADVPAQNFPALNLNTGKNDSFYRYSETKLYEVPDVDYTNYTEGIYVGYRHYVTRDVPVAYPFGYGLSYTDFTIGDLHAEAVDGGWVAVCTVTNTGRRAGREVVQLYASAPAGRTDKPRCELRAYAKTPLLEPGEAAEVRMPLAAADLASFDEEASAWVTEAGGYTLRAARNVAEPGATTVVEVTEPIVRKVCTAMRPEGGLFIAPKV